MRTRGQATAIGGILFLFIAILIVNFLYEVYNIQAVMNQFDTDRLQEGYRISDVLFGDQKKYSTQTVTILAGSGTDPFFPSNITSTITVGRMFPIPNMNFSDSADYWSFTRSFYGTGSGSSGASGAYTTDPTGSPSGAGAIYVDFRYNPPPGKYAGAFMNWTTRFYIDLTELGGAAAITFAKLSWGRRITLFDTVTGPSPGAKCPITVYFVDPNGVEHQVDGVTVDGADTGWVQRSNLDVSAAFIPTSGWYKIILVSQVELGHSGTGPPKFQAYFDDVGLALYGNIHTIDWYGSFTIEEAPTLVEQIDLSYTGRFNVTRSQKLYIMDASTNRWVLLGTSTVSTSSRTFKYTFLGSEAQKYISKTGEIKTRVYASGATPFICAADSMSVKDYFTGTTGKITVSFTNTGGVSVRLVSLWIVDSMGHHRFDLNINLTPGQTTQHIVAHIWSYGEYTFKAITDKGTIATYTTTA